MECIYWALFVCGMRFQHGYAPYLGHIQAHLGHKINGNKIHESEKSIRSNVIKIDKVLRQRPYTYEGRRPAPITTVRPFRIRQKMNKPSLPANHAKTTSRKGFCCVCQCAAGQGQIVQAPISRQQQRNILVE